MAAQDNHNSYYDPSEDETVTVELHSIDLMNCPHCSKFVAAYTQRCPYCKERIVATTKNHSWIFAASTAVLLTLLCAGVIGHYLGM